MIKKIILCFFILQLCTISYYSVSYSNGPPSAHSSAPSEYNCTHCHYGPEITSGHNWDFISLTSNFTGNGYIPDSTYIIKISSTQLGISTWGFETTVLDARDSMAGSFSGSGRVQVISSSNFSRDYVIHNYSGQSSTGTNSTDWVFTWKAPSKNVGPLTFYLCLIAANGDYDHTGDSLYSKTFTIYPSNLLPVAKVSSDSLACIGTDIKLNGSSTNSATNWNWQLIGATPNYSTSQNPIVKYGTQGTYWAVLSTKNIKGFSKPDSFKIRISEKPNPILSSANPQNLFCDGSSAMLSVLPSILKEYNFYLNGISKQKSASNKWLHSLPKDKDSVWVIASNGSCSIKSNTIFMDIKPLPDARFNFSFDGRTIWLSPAQGGYSSYKWNFGDGTSDTVAPSVSHRYLGIGNKDVSVRLTVTNIYGCSSFTESKITIPATISNTITYNSFKIYPNPSDHSFKFELSKDLINAEIIIVDNTGITVLKTLADKLVMELITTSLANGLYYIQIKKGEKYINSNLIINNVD